MSSLITCNHCGDMRTSDLNSKCPSCGSKKYPFMGYLYPQEGMTYQIVVIAVTGILAIALLLGIIYVRSAFFF